MNMEPIENKPNYLDFWEGCTGCGSKAVVVSIEFSCDDCPLCAECYHEYKESGIIPYSYKLKMIKRSITPENDRQST
jgi:hypothetical protein